ncbi:MAG: 1-phosphofructokinase [Armatimonadota bacterium]|nr:1-phosphofructokinase [Armatimonadota bacterium]
MILTVTLNASIDKTYTIESFMVDRINRPSQCRTVPGGKGINVARVLKELGREALATGFLGGSIGNVIAQGLDREGIKHDFVRVEDESRLCIKIVDPKNGTQTEINEPGPTVTELELEALVSRIDDLVRGCDFLVLSGNCPPGVPADFYAHLIRLARKRDVRAVLDASGEHMAEGVKAAPYMVKPNVSELSELTGQELCTVEEILAAAKSLREYGIEVVAVTMGRSGAVVTDGGQAWQAVPPEIRFASSVGSGDSFVAAFLDSLLRGDSLSEALAWGTAAGAANATTYGAGFCSKSSIIDIRQGVTLTQIA